MLGSTHPVFDRELGDFGSLTLQLSETSLIYQPLLPSAPAAVSV